MNRRKFLLDSAVLSATAISAPRLAAQERGRRFTPTHFASPTGAGRHDGSARNEWTLAEAYARATAGARVQFAPGRYVVQSGRVRTQALTPTHSGTAANPIVFFAEYPAVYNLDQPELQTTWVSDGSIHGTGSVTGHGENVPGGHYVVWDGISMRQVNGAWDSGELGVVSLFAGGNLQVKFLRCLFDQLGQGQMAPAFNWGAVFIQQTSGIEFSDCLFQNIPGSHSDENAMPFVTYAAGELEIHHCEFRDNNGGSIFLKGVQADSTHDNRPVRLHHCVHTGYSSLSLIFGAVGQGNVQNGQFCDVFQNIWHPRPDGLGLSIWWMDVSRGEAPRNVRLVNNTFVGHIPFLGGEEAFHRVKTVTEGDNIWRDSMFVNNIVQYTGADVPYVGVQYGNTTPVAIKKVLSDYNCFSSGFRNYAGMDLRGWQRLGQDVNSLVGNPGLQDVSQADFRLAPNSRVRATGSHPGMDVLGLQGTGAGAKINRGAYISPDMSDAIGIRPEPSPTLYRSYGPGHTPEMPSREALALEWAVANHQHRGTCIDDRVRRTLGSCHRSKLLSRAVATALGLGSNWISGGDGRTRGICSRAIRRRAR